MIIAVASGKGGTGKTTIATNLALSIGEDTGENVQLIDCDVEEPNSHIFLKQLKLEKVQDVNIPIPCFDMKKCNFCGECSDFCQYNAIAVMKNDVTFFPELCHGCGGCLLVCQRDAITEKEKNIGIIERGIVDGIEFYQGLMNVGEPLAVPIIRELKKRMDERKSVVLDVPPGTACPVIEAVRGADFCILVTEPTPFGLHDLKLAVEVVRDMRIPIGIIINRDGIGDDRVEKYCEEENLPVILKVPNRREIAGLYSRGIPFTEEMPEWREKFIELHNTIKEAVRG